MRVCTHQTQAHRGQPVSPSCHYHIDEVHQSAILGLTPTDWEKGAKNYLRREAHSCHRDVSLFQFIDGVD